MKTKLTVQIDKNQIITILQELNHKDRISVLKKFKDDWVNNIIDLQDPEPYTIDEYNAKLNEGEEAYKKGNVIKHKDLVNEVESWKKKKR